MRLSKGQCIDSIAVISMGCIKRNIDDVESIVYMNHVMDLNSNVDTDDILSLLAE